MKKGTKARKAIVCGSIKRTIIVSKQNFLPNYIVKQWASERQSGKKILHNVRCDARVIVLPLSLDITEDITCWRFVPSGIYEMASNDLLMERQILPTEHLIRHCHVTCFMFARKLLPTDAN
jgi:hypothetical protein